MVNAKPEGRVLKDELGPIKCSPEILKLMGSTEKPMA
jgi:hypothetical protein